MWQCGQCGCRNDAGNRTCEDCGHPRYEDPHVVPPSLHIPVDEQACPNCAGMVPKKATKCRLCGASLIAQRDAAQRREIGWPGDPPEPDVSRDTRMEAHLAAFGFWDALAGVLLFLAAPFLILGAHADMGRRMNLEVAYIFAFFLVGFGIGLFLIGLGLRRRSNAARVSRILLSVPMMLLDIILVIVDAGSPGALFRLVWHVIILFTFLGQRARRVCSQDYRTVVALRPGQAPTFFQSAYIWIPAAFIAYSIVLGLA